MNSISTSAFDIFKICPGPSSSHTLGPMKAAACFRRSCGQLDRDDADGIEVVMYGSLAATGPGHGTDRAVIAGLLGWDPVTCPTDELNALGRKPGESWQFDPGSLSVTLKASDLRFDTGDHELAHPNTMIFRLKAGDVILLEEEYHSIGGGFIRARGEHESAPVMPPYPYANMRQLRSQMQRHSLPLVGVLRVNERAISGLDDVAIDEKLDTIIDVMAKSVERGLVTDGLLPGPIGLGRKASVLHKRLQGLADSPERFLILLNAAALAASEENAAGNRVVTAPTSGSAGVIPAVLHVLTEQFAASRSILRDAMLVAAAIGAISRHNASISGAEVGCQGEIGVASSMAAALIAHVRGFGVEIVENAAEIALEHHLGLTCDPIGGYVQIPCIERNAFGAVHAFNAFLLASAGDPARQKIGFDAVVEAMLETGLDMCSRYRETAQAGMARCAIRC